MNAMVNYVIGLFSELQYNTLEALDCHFSSQSGEMAWSAPDGLLSRLLSGDPLAILIAFIFAISLPILVHSFLYRTSDKSATTPTFLLLGTSGAGKTSLLTLVRLIICNFILLLN